MIYEHIQKFHIEHIKINTLPKTAQYKKSSKITVSNVGLAIEGLGIIALFVLTYLGIVPFFISAIVSATVVLIQLFVIVNKYNSNDKKPKKEKIKSEKKNVKYATPSDLK